MPRRRISRRLVLKPFVIDRRLPHTGGAVSNVCIPTHSLTHSPTHSLTHSLHPLTPPTHSPHTRAPHHVCEGLVRGRQSPDRLRVAPGGVIGARESRAGDSARPAP